MAYSHSLTLAWSVSAEDERRFRRFLGGFLAVTIAIGIVIPLLPVVEKKVSQEVELPPRVAKLIFEKRTQPKVKPKPKPVKKLEKPKPVAAEKPKVKPKPKPEKKVVTKTAKKTPPQKPRVDRTELARKKAASSGVLAMQDSLADLRNDSSLKQLRSTHRLSSTGSQAKKTTRSMVTSKISSGSQGIVTSGLSRDTGGTRLAGRTTTRVASPVKPDSARTRSSGSSLSAARSIEEIQIVFDKNKGAIFSIYNRELRKNPALKGKLVFRITIAPSGKVIKIELASSELGVPALEQKLLRRVKLFNFGAKQVDTVTISYPIDFLPA